MAVSKVDLANQVENELPNANLATIATTKLGTGAVLQLQSTTFSTTSTSTSSSYADITGAALSITPSSTSSKIYFSCNLSGVRKAAGNTYMGVKLFRQINSGGYSEIEHFDNGLGYTGTTVTITIQASYSYLDSPATTDQVDYKLQFNSGANIDRVKVNVDAQEASTVTLMEIAG